jgi:hypothetical protein
MGQTRLKLGLGSQDAGLSSRCASIALRLRYRAILD